MATVSNTPHCPLSNFSALLNKQLAVWQEHFFSFFCLSGANVFKKLNEIPNS